MDSTAKPAPAGAEDQLLAHGDTKSNGDYERVVREELARVQERLAQLAPVGMAAAAPPEVKITPDAFDPNSSSADKLDANITAFRAADVNGVDVNGVEGESLRPSAKRGVVRILIGLLVAGTIVGAGAAWAAYGEDVKPLIDSVTPQIATTWSLISEKLGLSGEQSAPPAQSATVDTPAQQTALAQPTTPPAAATPAAPADVAQVLQSMARDIASLQQGIEQLKAGQEQMARDNAKLTEQLKASQEQMSRAMARASEASMHPRLPLPAPKPPLVAASRKPLPPPPVSTLPPPQTIAPAAQAQQQAEETQVPGAPRPPKPVP